MHEVTERYWTRGLRRRHLHLSDQAPGGAQPARGRRPRSLGIVPATKGYVDLSQWEEVVDVVSKPVVGEELLAGRYDSGLTHLEHFEGHEDELRLDLDIGEIDTTWVVYGTRSASRRGDRDPFAGCPARLSPAGRAGLSQPFLPPQLMAIAGLVSTVRPLCALKWSSTWRFCRQRFWLFSSRPRLPPKRFILNFVTGASGTLRKRVANPAVDRVDEADEGHVDLPPEVGDEVGEFPFAAVRAEVDLALERLVQQRRHRADVAEDETSADRLRQRTGPGCRGC